MKKLIFLAILIMVSCENGKDLTRKDSSKDFDKICIEGHVYFHANIPYKGFLAPKLNDNGLPVRCMRGGMDKK